MAPSLVVLGYNTQLEQDGPHGDLKPNSILLVCCRSRYETKQGKLFLS